MGLMLSREQLEKFAGEVIDVVAGEVDADTAAKIADKIIESIDNVGDEGDLEEAD